jgi:DNA (cytosine-5)-methyltransferase 1
MPADGSLFGRVRGPIVIDGFAGGGGASLGIKWALGVEPVVAFNHCAHAIETYGNNHPGVELYKAEAADVSPIEAARGRQIDLAWFSPDCTDHSRAKAGKPRETGKRALAWIVIDWARQVRPRVIMLENVVEWLGWGPLYPDDYPVVKLRRRRIPERAGEYFQAWRAALEAEGYTIEWRKRRAADRGVPTTRERLFLIARCDGQPIVWPEATHTKAAGTWRPASDCIDFDNPVRSIFGRKKPLADKTLARIAEGVDRYVLRSANPFLLTLTHGGRLVPLDRPLPTVTAGPRGGDQVLVGATLINTRNGERKGQRPRVRDIHDPYGTVTGKGSQGALVSAAFMSKHYGGVVGHDLDRPLGTVTGTDHHALTSVALDRLRGEVPAGTIRCAAFLARYFGSGGQWSDCRAPMPTVTAREGLSLVTVTLGGDEWVMTDIGMRMLAPRELARANGFPDSYKFHGTIGDQIERIGNAVVPQEAESLVSANLPEFAIRSAA